MHLFLTGATGLVGSSVLNHILTLTPSVASQRGIQSLTILQRRADVPLLIHPQRPTANTRTDINTITHSNFSTYPTALLSRLQLQSTTPENESIGVVWALGVSQTETNSAEQYTEITKVYPLTFAREIARHFAPRTVNFVYVSGEGATSSPGILTPLFGRVKGETERELLALARRPEMANLNVYNVRPAGVDPISGQSPAVEDGWRTKMESWGVFRKLGVSLLLPSFRTGLFKGMHSPTEELGTVFTGLAVGNGQPISGKGVEDGGRTLPNVVIRRLAGEME